MRAKSLAGRCAERTLRGFDDAGRDEWIVIWIERRPDGMWGVGRMVNPQHRETDEPRHDDWLFEGHELGDALQTANDALEDDVSVLEQDGATSRVRPFMRKEVIPFLERYFFGRG